MGNEISTAPVLSVGVELAERWRVIRVLDEVDGLEAALCESEGSGRAICTPIGPAEPDPLVGEGVEGHWGTARCVLRDERFGRIVVDEIPEGPLLSDRIAAGRGLPPGLLAEIGARVRDAHRAGYAHGLLSAERVVVGDEGAVIAGWGLGARDFEARRARDLALISALSGASLVPEPTGAVSSEDEDPEGEPSRPLEGPDPVGLRAAIRAEHGPTLLRALDAWEQGGGSLDAPDALRARDALARLERRVATHIAEAEKLLAEGDTLGVVVACREAIRLGAEERGEELLALARRKTKRQLGGRSLPPTKVLAMGGAGVLALLVLVVALALGLREPAEEGALRDRVENIAEVRGERAAVSHLVALNAAEESGPLVTELLGARLGKLAESERARLLSLREQVLKRGARPLEADTLSTRALEELEVLAASSPEPAVLGARLQAALADVDRAASLYRASVGIDVSDVTAAVDALLARDPVFAPREEKAR